MGPLPGQRVRHPKPPSTALAGDATRGNTTVGGATDNAGLMVTSLGAGLVVGAVTTVAGALVVLTTGERVGILLVATLLGGISRVLWVFVRRRRNDTPTPELDSNAG